MIDDATPLGTTFDGPVRRMSIERLLAFSGGRFSEPGWPARNLHTDAAKAAEAGLARPIASGLQPQGHIIRLMLDLSGEAWSRAGSIRLRFRRPVYVGDSIRARARLTDRTADSQAIVYTLEVWSERQDGEIAVTGSATCRIQKAGEQEERH
ncbi:MAG: MaoC family dehydratase [Betaproteobacteria bacterium]|nr:MaoC family dehydratase [Betaproteobacteria bacterium]